MEVFLQSFFFSLNSSIVICNLLNCIEYAYFTAKISDLASSLLANQHRNCESVYIDLSSSTKCASSSTKCAS